MNFLLSEDGSYLLFEDGYKIILESGGFLSDRHGKDTPDIRNRIDGADLRIIRDSGDKI